MDKLLILCFNLIFLALIVLYRILENFLLGIGQGNPRSICCGVFSYQKCHWTKTVETIFGWPFWLSDFQIDLALSLMNYGISLQWDGESDERPNFMRQDPFVPCDSNRCFFCFNGIITGIAHPPKKNTEVIVEFKCGPICNEPICKQCWKEGYDKHA